MGVVAGAIILSLPWKVPVFSLKKNENPDAKDALHRGEAA
jgi:hypothetical protein